MVAYGIHCRRTASREGELELSALEWLQLASSRLRASPTAHEAAVLKHWNTEQLLHQDMADLRRLLLGIRAKAEVSRGTDITD